MERKTYQAQIEFKQDADQTGEFRAEFATLNVVDHDGDVTEPGAFQAGQQTLIEAWNHNYAELPVGKGVIHEEGDKAVIDGKFFLNTEGGLQHYRTVKAIGAMQEWSYTFDIEESVEGEFDGQDVRFLRSLDVWGVAPVQRGAGIDTRTTDIKNREDSAKGAGDGASDGAGDGEGEAGDGNPDGKPSGWAPRDVQVQLDILKLSMEV